MRTSPDEIGSFHDERPIHVLHCYPLSWSCGISGLGATSLDLPEQFTPWSRTTLISDGCCIIPVTFLDRRFSSHTVPSPFTRSFDQTLPFRFLGASRSGGISHQLTTTSNPTYRLPCLIETCRQPGTVTETRIRVSMGRDDERSGLGGFSHPPRD